jgi:glyoxylase-like metal-dependent hydrolase (beta-lactamase superfamily II)/ferredoxin
MAEALNKCGRSNGMASLQKKVAENVAGAFFVDTTCINCDACRQLAPATFADSGAYSFVYSQPDSAELERQAMRALLACPTGSIGTVHANNASEVKADFPLLIEDDVYYCGFNSRKSYGGNSYFIRHPAGNWLVDSPRFLPFLANQLERLGGVRYIFLTHRDDVADADQYARRFGSQRIIHREEVDAQPGAERVIDGMDPVELAPEFLCIPTPGHTSGHCVLLHAQRFLFTGDHLDWSREDHALWASRDYCWDSWADQTRSMAKLLDYSFEWVLPGHGQRVKLPRDVMRRELAALVQRMQGDRAQTIF